MITIHGVQFVGRKGLAWRIGEDSYANAPAGFEISVALSPSSRPWQSALLDLLKQSEETWLRPGQDGRWAVDLDAYSDSREGFLGPDATRYHGKWEALPEFDGRIVHFTIKL